MTSKRVSVIFWPTFMPNLKQATKALRQSLVRADRNKKVRNEIDSLLNRMRKLVTAKKIDEAKTLMKTLDKKLDKAVTKHVYKMNTVARVKSRTMAKINTAAK